MKVRYRTHPRLGLLINSACADNTPGGVLGPGREDRRLVFLAYGLERATRSSTQDRQMLLC